MKYFLEKLLGNEIFRSMVSWATKNLLNNLWNPPAPPPTYLIYVPKGKGIKFINNNNIDGSCLNKNKLLLNKSGTALLVNIFHRLFGQIDYAILKIVLLIK